MSIISELLVDGEMVVGEMTVNLGNKCFHNKKCQLRGKEGKGSACLRGTQIYKIDLQTITL